MLAGNPVLYLEGDQVIGTSPAGMSENQNKRDEARC